MDDRGRIPCLFFGVCPIRWGRHVWGSLLVARSATLWSGIVRGGCYVSQLAVSIGELPEDGILC